MRKIHTIVLGTRIAHVYRDAENNEYVVRFYTNGKHNKMADYFTDDKLDAVQTADHWVVTEQGIL